MINQSRATSDIVIDVKGITKRFDNKVVVDSLDLSAW